MKERSQRWLISAAASAVLLAGGLGLAARAQDAGDDSAAPPPPPPPPSVAAPPSAIGAGATTTTPNGNAIVSPGNGFRRGNRGGFGGTVASVTSTGFTFTSRRGNQTVTVTTTPETKYTVTHEGAISSIKMGDTVQVMGRSDATAKTVQAFLINDGAAPQFGGPRGPRPGAAGGPGGPGGFASLFTVGTVVSTSPLKVKDASGTVFTVTPQDETSQVSFSTSGTLSDVAVGKYVTVRPNSASGPVDPTSTSITAGTVIVSPTAPRFGGGGFGGRRGGFGGPGGGFGGGG